MTNNIKLIALDLDGTLLNSDSEFGEYTKEVLNRMMDQGIKIIPISGRSIDQIPNWLTEHKQIEYISCSNGASVIDNRSKDIVYEKLVTWDVVDQIMDLTDDVHNFLTLIVDGSYYSFKSMLDNDYGDNQDYMKELSFGRTFVDTYEEIKDRNRSGAEKIHFGFLDLDLRSKTVDKLANFKDAMVTSSHYSNIEISHEHAGKGSAIQYLLDLYDLKPEEIIACGDNMNDVSMLELAKTRVVMEGAPESMAQLATYTVSNDNDELAKLLETLV